MIKRLFIYCLSVLSLCVLITACSDDDDKLPGMGEGEGEVVFLFVKNNTFDINKMEDIATLKVTVEKEGVQTVLPSLQMNGETDSLYSEPAFLKNGTYQIVSYKLFAANAFLLAEVEPESDTYITVEAAKRTECFFPIKIKVVYISNTIKNVLLGICREVFGEDKSKWPWNEDEADIAKWPNLEFVTDEDTGEIMYLSDIIFDEKFAPMKKVPNGLAALATLEGLIFRNIDMEELPDDLGMTNISSLEVVNTKLRKFPTNLSRSLLASIAIINSELEELPAEIGKLEETMRDLQISGSHLKTIPEEIGKLTKLVNFKITDSELTSLPDIFEPLYRLSHLDFSNNPGLISLPASIARVRDLRGIVLSGCGFTEVPSVLKECTLMRNIWLENNQLSALAANEFSGNIKLEGLYLSGNAFSSFPALQIPTLLDMRLNDCGLRVCPDLSGLPELRMISLEGNALASMPSGYFSANEKLVKFSLANNSTLNSLPQDLGIALDDQQKPALLALVDVSNCPELSWTIPGNWCCMQVQSAEEIKKYDPNYTGGDVIIRRVNVKRDGSSQVTRQACPVCGSAE